MRMRWRRSGCATLVAAAAAPAAATASTRGRGGLGGDAIAITGGGSEDRELHAGFLAGALGAGDFLLLLDDDLLKTGITLFTKVFVDGHSGCSFDPFVLHGIYFDYSRSQ